MDQHTLVSFLEPLIRTEGKKLLTQWSKSENIQTRSKEGLDVVTALDEDIEESLVAALKKEFPHVGFQVEEHANLNSEQEYQWIIDPIDGTKYFASAVPLFCISIGLTYKKEPIWGMIYNPISDQLYVGGTELPARLNDKPIQVRVAQSLEQTILSVDFSKSGEMWPTYKQWTIHKIAELADATYRIRMIGSGALSLAWVAQGSVINAYIAISPITKFVDIAAGLAIASAAGAHIASIPHPVDTTKDIYIVGSENIVQDIRAIITS